MFGLVLLSKLNFQGKRVWCHLTRTTGTVKEQLTRSDSYSRSFPCLRSIHNGPLCRRTSTDFTLDRPYTRARDHSVCRVSRVSSVSEGPEVKVRVSQKFPTTCRAVMIRSPVWGSKTTTLLSRDSPGPRTSSSLSFSLHFVLRASLPSKRRSVTLPATMFEVN